MVIPSVYFSFTVFFVAFLSSDLFSEVLTKGEALCEGGSEEECVVGKKMMLSLRLSLQ
jgi:hypothetical protein